MTHSEEDQKTWSVFYDDVTKAHGKANGPLKGLTRGSHGQALYDDLDVKPDDLKVEKNRFSAFIQGSSDLDKLLEGSRHRHGAGHRHGHQHMLRIDRARRDDAELQDGDGLRRECRRDRRGAQRDARATSCASSAM